MWSPIVAAVNADEDVAAATEVISAAEGEDAVMASEAEEKVDSVAVVAAGPILPTSATRMLSQL